MKTTAMLPAATLVTLAVFHSLVFAQDPRAAVEKALESQYPLTQPTGDKRGIVIPGALLVLQKNVVDMVPVSTAANPLVNTYKDGNLSPSRLGSFISVVGVAKRSFVRGEKMYATKITVKDDGVYFDLLTDPMEDVRYKGIVKFPFPRNHTLTPEQALSNVAQVFSVDASQPASEAPAGRAQPATPQSSASAGQPVLAAPTDTPPPPIAPPPPPADVAPATPPAISINQTKQQVEAKLGKPERVVQMNRKEIYFYKNVKVTFTDGKVSHFE